ncbi:PREDICTED: olfactory receptor 7E24-like [Chinchilla lanigera]|uniref:Olfactory receptor 7E24-like n=1 Tax=Chinchilla lanigera TaxID=34839 RepID=A0A8C2V3Q6_CHILA|nr:PREDICTED: olfactory receptor 7E24-like [Chinchilla lanigera]
MTNPSRSVDQCPNNTDTQNLKAVVEFRLLKLSTEPDLQPILFLLFLSMYVVTVLGNLLIILAVSLESQLHTPMYFFLSNLSLADICFISTTVPKMIVDILTRKSVISYAGCLTQMSLLILFGCMDYMLLTVMAYYRFVAICQPLQYSIIMNSCFCIFLVFVSFLFSLMDSQLHNLIVLKFTYFQDASISSFCCEPTHILKMDCMENFTKNIITYFVGAIFVFFPISVILFSYYKIISSILRIPSSGGKYKAFSTCGSHLSVVCLFYGTSIGMYLESTLAHSPRKSVVSSIMYTIVTPMLNPFIYSLRNKDIKNALRRLYSRKF